MTEEDTCPAPRMLYTGVVYYSGGAEQHKGGNYNPNKVGGIGYYGGDTGDGPLSVPECLCSE